MKSGIELISEERQEQIIKHGRTVELDVRYNQDNQLIQAAIHLIQSEEGFDESDMELIPEEWDESVYRKMLLKPYLKRLAIAGALIAAKIDSYQYEEEVTFGQ